MNCDNVFLQPDHVPNDDGEETEVLTIGNDNPLDESRQPNPTEIRLDSAVFQGIAHTTTGYCTGESTGLIGSKRSSVGSIDHKTKKRICLTTIDISSKTIHDINPSLTQEEVEDVLQDYKYALRILKSRPIDKQDIVPTLEYMTSLINDWKPRREIICMYIRWSKRLRRNFHLDSISTLLCVAKQCDYKPYIFLKKVKTLTITRSTTTYGLTFKFDVSGSKGVDGKKLKDKFLGLSITLRLLQRAVVTDPGALGKIGLKTRRAEGDANGGDSIFLASNSGNDTNEKRLVSEKPTSRFHTTSGLHGRIWLAIQHRWLALQIVEVLFPTQLAHSTSEDESLAYTFQMHSSSGPTRFDFLEPLIGVCLRYRSTSIIDNHLTILQAIWQHPSSFVAFGNRLFQSVMASEKIECIVDTFKYLQSTVETCKNVTIHMKTSRETKWQMIRGYAFHFWLERDLNHILKTKVDSLCKTCSNHQRKGRQHPLVDDTMIAAIHPIRPFVDKTRNTTTVGVSAFMGTQDGGLSKLVKSRPKQSMTETSLLNNSVISPERSTTDTSLINNSKVRYGTTQQTKDANASNDPMLFHWASCRLATQTEITSRVSSRLMIHREDGITLVQNLSPLEVYSANMLHRWKHSRRTGTTSDTLVKTDVGDVVLSIGCEVQQFLDQSSKSFHVVREDSTYFREHGDLFPSVTQIAQLCKAVFKYGQCDERRSTKQFRVNIGCGGQHKPNGRPETLIGMNFKNRLDMDNDFNSNELIGTIGLMTQFTWNVMKDIQDACGDCPLAPDFSRRVHYASHLAKYLQMSDDVGFEDVTIVVGVLYPVMPSVAEHVDSMNDTVAGYTRTGALNIVLLLSHATDVVLVHLQVLCNFRKVVREYLFPYHKLLSSIITNCSNYLRKWQANMSQIYGGRTQQIPNPFDRSSLFMDDTLPFCTLTISGESKNRKAITGEYLLTEISPSRVLSFSMFIDPIVDLRECLCYDQLIELCFVASLLSNPFWFEHCLSSLTHMHSSNDRSFHFGQHPLYDWAKETMSLFGGWQGGPHNRWSPCGGSVPFPNLFGAHAEASENEQKIGILRLEQVVRLLYQHLEWVQGLKGKLADVTRDLPLSIVEEHMTSVVEAIYKIVPCQFNVFRLMVFTTLCVGCGMIEEGVHLKAIVYPVKGSASFKHLTNIERDQMTRSRALSLCGKPMHDADTYDQQQTGIESERHDQVMLYVSTELGMSKFVRDETECILCEAHPNRNLQCRDWFKKGRRIYDLDLNGHLLQREYGRETKWNKMKAVKAKKFAFLTEISTFP